MAETNIAFNKKYPQHNIEINVRGNDTIEFIHTDSRGDSLTITLPMDALTEILVDLLGVKEVVRHKSDQNVKTQHIPPSIPCNNQDTYRMESLPWTVDYKEPNRKDEGVAYAFVRVLMVMWYENAKVPENTRHDKANEVLRHAYQRQIKLTISLPSLGELTITPPDCIADETTFLCQTCGVEYRYGSAKMSMRPENKPAEVNRAGDQYHPGTFCSKTCENSFLKSHHEYYPTVTHEIPIGEPQQCNITLSGVEKPEVKSSGIIPAQIKKLSKINHIDIGNILGSTVRLLTVEECTNLKQALLGKDAKLTEAQIEELSKDPPK